ncbi:zinc finger BED domain-containing protein 4-like [Hydra vulgaris]|uniref:Zinc finger BED domain-containing protein 4-like n=1 Tax=Hydra vulgaris TaxID=6087 RepID=A0ABM4CM18_HYDVU
MQLLQNCYIQGWWQSLSVIHNIEHAKAFKNLHKSEIKNQKHDKASVIDFNICEDSSTAGPSCKSSPNLAFETPMPREPRSTTLSSAFTSLNPKSEDAEINTRSSFSTIISIKMKPRSSSTKQPTIHQVFAKTRPLTSTDPKTIKITRLIAEMICTDNQPVSIVENPGFKRLLQFLEPSITTDMWSSTANDDYMSLTAHFLTEDMKQIHICLDVVPFPYESHTATNLVNFMNESLERWGLLEKLNVLVRDNVRNIVSAMDVGKFTNIPCLAHTLQLVVKDGCLNNERISLLAATCRRIVGHFKHLVKSYKLLRQSQEILGRPKHSIIQDEPTRWNSTFHMLNRLIEQKDAILLVTPHFPKATRQNKELSTGEWDGLVPLVAALKVFEEVTLTASSSKVTTSEVIPIINAVNMSIDRIKDYGNFKDSVSRTMAEKAVTLLIGEFNAFDIDEGHEIKAAENQEPTTPAPGAVWSLYN